MDFLHTLSHFQRLINPKQPLRTWHHQKLSQLIKIQLAIKGAGQSGMTFFKTSHGFLKRFFKCSADGHHFADAFHLRAEYFFSGGKFFKRKSWNFDDDVIKNRFKGGFRFLGDHIR